MPGYDNEGQVLADAAGLQARIEAAYTEDARGWQRPGPWQQQRAEYLVNALEAAGIELGEYDRQSAYWLCGGELATVQVIARWVTEAAGVEIPALPSRCEAAGELGSTEACDGPADAVRVFDMPRIPSEKEKELGGTLGCRLHGSQLYARIDPSRSTVYPNGGKDGRNAGAAIEVYKRAEQIRAGAR